MKKLFLACLSLFLFLVSENSMAQTTAEGWTKHQTKKWFAKKEWLGGLSLRPHKTINKKTFALQYHLNKSYWDKSFAFLKEKDLQNMPAGRYVIDGENVFAIITQNPTKKYDSTKWESHKKYVDLQYVISGKEKIGIHPASSFTVSMPYDDSKDLMNYSGEGKLYDAMPGFFFLFFPSDAHRPNITPGGNQPDKKIVIKIRYAQ